jgi:hypothetical protein
VEVEGTVKDVKDEFDNIISTEYIITKVINLVEKSE